VLFFLYLFSGALAPRPRMPRSKAALSGVTSAPTSGYVTLDQPLETQVGYVLRVIGDDGEIHFVVIRLDLLDYDQDDNALMIFDLAYRVQSENPDLVESAGN
jgi:hypothetical protein